MPKQYFLRKIAFETRCCLYIDSDQYNNIRAAFNNYIYWNYNTAYIEIPESCVRKVYGIDNMPINQLGIRWFLPWPQC
jgi:hypothetical protein